jgi:hypothetical protein
MIMSYDAMDAMIPVVLHNYAIYTPAVVLFLKNCRLFCRDNAVICRYNAEIILFLNVRARYRL